MMNLRGQMRNSGEREENERDRERNFKSLYYLPMWESKQAIKWRMETNELENICHRMYRIIKT